MATSLLTARPGFRRILEAVAVGFRDRRTEVEEAANRLAEAVANAETFVGARGKFDSGVADDQIESIVNMFDARNGGFGRSPKFPHPAALDLLLERHQAGGGARLLQITLTRIFSFSLWYHFAYVTISVALLGYGASGALLAVFPGLAALVTLCGLFVDPEAAAQKLQALASMLPAGTARP